MALERWRPMGSLMRRGPFEAVERQMEDVLDRMFRGWPTRRLDADLVGWVPPLDMVDRKNEVVLRADLPGLDREDIQLSVENGVLTLQGSRQQEKEDKGDDFYAMERWAGAFSRSIALPQGLDPDRVEASFKNGVLEIRVPKTKEAAGKKIDIKVA
ncbi:MAG: Hsp20/alpha crystallin family protein [Deltaproteobacteria bacterium]|nr:Hsp20/alpha crystallin family protein [Deltaproteobacteria bacterium]